jgi:3-hydroxyisobutyrate dehydrogenase and related beta-hydroxyacid dehydrogenases
MKAFLGMGLLGSNFVKAMLKQGEQVQVWNRTTSRAKELEQFGAKSFDNINDAVNGADIIHLTLKDDASVNEVLNAARGSITPGAVIIDHTTTSKDGAIQRTKEWNERGVHYQHAPVFMGPVNALEGSGFMMVSGDQALIAKLQPQLSKMTGKLLHFGPEVGKAAAMKLVGNTFLICFVAGIRDTLAVAKALHAPIADLFTLFEDWNPGTMLQARLKRMTSGDYSLPSWELNMARKDAGLFIEASKNKTNLALIPSIAELMDQWIDKGYGNADWTVIAKDLI